MINKIEKVNNKFKFNYFPNIKGVDRTKIQLTTEGIYSISDNLGSDKLVFLIFKYFNSNDLTITDATGNNGSDTIAMGLKFTHINSIELDKTNFKVLENNVKQVYNLNNVDLFNGDSLEYLSKLKQDIIYIDAPWGGTDYKKNKYIELYMSGKNMGWIYNKYKSNAKLFIFKLPINYNFTNFIQTTMVTKYYMYLYKKNDKPKFFLLFVPTKK
jgi:hypothetical protein